MLFAVKLQLLRLTEFLPSMTIPSEVLEVRVASLTVISAVEYIDGEPVPDVSKEPPVTVTISPPLSDLMAADELPEVFIVTLVAFIVPPPVVISPPEQLPDVSIVESDILTVVPSP